MLFQWDCQNRNPVLLIATKSNTYQEASIIEILCVETAQCYFNGNVKTSFWIQTSTTFDNLET